MSYAEEYAKYFPAEAKVGVGIPMENNELFRDWAIVNDLDGEMINLQLSRDELPTGVHLTPGCNLELRIGIEGKGYRCNGFFVSSEGGGAILVHLTGTVASSELREFYRLDLFLPFRYEKPQIQNLDHLIVEWRQKKQWRVADELERRDAFQERRREFVYKAASGALGEEEREQDEFSPADESWDTEMAHAVNISAGGFKFISSDHFDMDDLLLMEVFIPSHPPRIMDCVASVVFKNRNYAIKDGPEYHNIAVRFMLIDERDRDAIVSHISNIETIRIRKQRLGRVVKQERPPRRFSLLKGIAATFAILIIFGLLGYYFYNYATANKSHEIQDTFQGGLKKYMERIGRPGSW